MPELASGSEKSRDVLRIKVFECPSGELLRNAVRVILKLTDLENLWNGQIQSSETLEHKLVFFKAYRICI